MLEPDDTLIDRIYEAAALPDMWINVLDSIGERVGYDKSLLFAHDGRAVIGFRANAACVPIMAGFAELGMVAENKRDHAAVNYPWPEFFGDLDLFTQETIDSDPMYQQFHIPRGIAWVAGTTINGPEVGTLAFSFTRALEHGPATREEKSYLTALRPHLARAALLSSRLRLEEARAAVSALERIGMPAAALYQGKKLRLANGLFEALIPRVMRDRNERIAFTDKKADALLQQALESVVNGMTFPVVVDDERFMVHLIPVKGAANDIFGMMDTLLVAIPIAVRGNANPRALQGLFDLTPAEARIANGLLDGKTLGQIAVDRNISVQTVRTQLKSVLSKTRTSRQVDLVRLLASTQTF